MVHKTYEVIGERVLIDTGEKQKQGIFQESDQFRTSLEGGRAALDFIEPLYKTNPQIEELAKGLNPVNRIDPENPILSIHAGIDHPQLEYFGIEKGIHVFKGEFVYIQGAYFNDGHTKLFDKYRDVLIKAGFKIKGIEQVNPADSLKILYPKTWELRERLEKLIHEEKYEKAAIVRDEINSSDEPFS